MDVLTKARLCLETMALRYEGGLNDLVSEVFFGNAQSELERLTS